EQDAAKAHLEVLEHRGQVVDSLDPPGPTGPPEALKRAVNAKPVVFKHEAAHHLTSCLGDQHSTVDLDDGLPGCFVAVLDGAFEQREPCRVVDRLRVVRLRVVVVVGLDLHGATLEAARCTGVTEALRPPRVKTWTRGGSAWVVRAAPVGMLVSRSLRGGG